MYNLWTEHRSTFDTRAYYILRTIPTSVMKDTHTHTHIYRCIQESELL